MCIRANARSQRMIGCDTRLLGIQKRHFLVKNSQNHVYLQHTLKDQLDAKLRTPSACILAYFLKVEFQSNLLKDQNY